MRPNVHRFQRYGRVKLASGTLFWQEVGEQGDTLVFLHGSWHDSSQWSALMPLLGSYYHCLAPDLLGFGESQAVFPAYSIELQVETLALFLDTLRIQRCYLIGHSLGAWVAGRYALRYPHQVQGLVVIAPEGVSVPALAHRWRSQRWLARRVSPFTTLLQLGSPIIRVLGGRQWLQQIQAQRQQLLTFPATCQTLFGRRAAAIQAEEITTLPDHLPLLALESSTPSPTEATLSQAYRALIPGATGETIAADETPFGLNVKATAQALREFCQQAVNA